MAKERNKMVGMATDGNYALLGVKCNTCGQVAFMDREMCPICASFAGNEKVFIGRKGKVNNFTVAHVAPTGYNPPYILSFVDIEEGPRIFATIEGDLEVAAKLKKGDPVHLKVTADGNLEEDGVLRWTYVLD